MVKVKLFCNTNLVRLEDELNRFLEARRDVVDIKLAESEDYWSALVIYNVA